jgi:hypothetical protein
MKSFETLPIYLAAEIAMRYFAATGHDAREALHKSVKHIFKLFDQGERRTLMLANRAIEAVEREEQAERVSTEGEGKPFLQIYR